MSVQTENRADLVRRCRSLEKRFIRIASATGKDCSIAIGWARQWVDALLDTRCPTALYANWVAAQEQRADRLEAHAAAIGAL